MSSLSASRAFKAQLSCSPLAWGALSHAQRVFRVTTIPEEAATEQAREFTPLASYPEQQLGMKVQFTPVNDYPAAVEALVNSKVERVWFGGFTHAQANLRSGGKIIPIARRVEDTRFHSVIIGKKDSGVRQPAGDGRSAHSRATLMLVDEPLSAQASTRAPGDRIAGDGGARARGYPGRDAAPEGRVLAYFPRVIGLRDGEVAFDLSAGRVDRYRLARLYKQFEHELHRDAPSATPEQAALPPAAVTMHCR